MGNFIREKLKRGNRFESIMTLHETIQGTILYVVLNTELSDTNGISIKPLFTKF